MGVTVYDTKKAKYYEVHPSMADDDQWLAQRGLIVQKNHAPIQATNMPQNEAGVESVKPSAKPTPTKTK